MRCGSCGFESATARKFCGECGAPLPRRCGACGAESPPAFKFCGECGERLGDGPTRHESAIPSSAPARDPRTYTPKHLADKILQSRSALEGERKQVTVLFADVKGSMELAESVDPEAWHEILDRFFQILADGVHRFEGTVNQYTGDGIMALFGAPIAHEDHAQRACYGALQLRDSLRSYAREVKRTHALGFAVRMGLNSGEVVVGKIGDDLRMDYTAQGHVVGLAARMQELADADAIYVAPATAALVAGYFDLEDLGEFRVQGVRDAVRVRQLRSAGTLRTRFDVSRSRGLSRFVGRADEMAALEAALARAREGNGQVVGVVAEPGVGKSRLCFELLERCRALGIRPLEGRALAHGKSVPFLTILQVFRAYYGITDQDSDRGAREKIAGRLLLLDESFREDLPLLFEFHGVPDPERPAPEMDPELRQRRLFAVLRRLVREGGRGEVGIVLLEDLHWLDGGSAAFLERWVEAVAGTRNLLLLNFRPEYHAAWMQRSWYQQLPLSPLGPEATRELLRDLLGSHASVAVLAEAIHGRTAGNPFFTEEVVQSLVESGQLEGAKGSYRLVGPVEEIAVPATVQAVLAARIDRVAEREKQVLQCAAVIGREFSLPILQRIAGLPARELTEALSRLEAAELLFAESLYPVAEYAFKHVLTQEVAYGTQLGERRRRLHAAVARAMEEVDASRLDDRAALLAHHCEQAGDALEAARWHRRAAKFAARSDVKEARSHSTRARALLAPLPASPERDGLLVRACVLLLELGWRLGLPEGEADELFAEGRALAERSHDLRSLAQLHLAYGFVLGNAADGEGRLREIRAALDVASRIPDGEPRARIALRALAQMGLSLHYLGRPREGLEAAEQALSLGDAAGGPRRSNGYALAVIMRGVNLLLLGHLAEARRELERGAATAREIGDVDSEMSAHLWHPFLAWIAGDAEEALAHARAALELGEDFGYDALALGRVGMAHLLASRWQEAAESLSQSVAIVRESGTGLQSVALHLALLAEAQLGGGLGGQARASAQESLELTQRQGERGHECLARIILARVLRATEGVAAHGEIESLLDAAEAIVKETGVVAFAPFVLEERAALARGVGDEAGWERSLRDAQRLFAEMGARPRAERLAREIGGSSSTWPPSEPLRSL